MGKLTPLPRKGESREEYRARLVALQNKNPLARMGLIKKLK